MMQLDTYQNCIYFVLMEHYIDGALNIAMLGYIVAPTFPWHINFAQTYVLTYAWPEPK